MKLLGGVFGLSVSNPAVTHAPPHRGGVKESASFKQVQGGHILVSIIVTPDY